MKTEFNLSEKADCNNFSSFHKASECPDGEECERIYNEDDIKEFIKRLKDYCENYITDDTTAIRCMIDKLAGDKLI